MENGTRGLYSICLAELVAVSAFGLVLPFLPYYVQELGVNDTSQIAIWSSLALTSWAVTMGIFAPIWGWLADRYGRKLMVERVMFGGALVTTAMAFVGNVRQLVLLRAIQGSLTGTVAAVSALVASTVPGERYGYAMGLVQTAFFSGLSVGPIVGGVLADTVGVRSCFLVAGALLAMAGFTIHLFVHEGFKPRTEDHSSARGSQWPRLRLVFSSHSLLLALGVRAAVRAGVRMVTPILPLLVQSLVREGGNAATTSGLIMGVSGMGSTLGALVLGRITDRVGCRLVLVLSTLSAAALYFPQLLVSEAWQLLILQAVTGVAVGGSVAASSALLARMGPGDTQGVVFGVDSSAMSLATAAGSLAGGIAAACLGLRSVFLCAGATLALAGLGAIKLGPALGNKR